MPEDKTTKTGYQKIISEALTIDAHSTDFDMRTVLQNILMIAKEENKKELSNTDQSADSSN